MSVSTINFTPTPPCSLIYVLSTTVFIKQQQSWGVSHGAWDICYLALHSFGPPWPNPTLNPLRGSAQQTSDQLELAPTVNEILGHPAPRPQLRWACNLSSYWHWQRDSGSWQAKEKQKLDWIHLFLTQVSWCIKQSKWRICLCCVCVCVVFFFYHVTLKVK